MVLAPASAAVRSLFERVVDELLHVDFNVPPPGWRILQQHEEHVLLWIDHDIGAGGTVPFELARRARRRRHGIAGIGAYAKAIAETKSVAGIIEIVAGDARSGPDMVGGHGGEGFRAEIALAVQRAAIEQHLAVARHIGDRRNQAGTAGFPSRGVGRIAVDQDTSYGRWCRGPNHRNWKNRFRSTWWDRLH